jgi:long-subunit acyl-CoA synthetase (AMP-forming)
MEATTMTGAPPSADEAFAAALDARTMCEAFQVTAAARPDQVALRTPDDSVSLTYWEVSQRVRALAAGLAGLGLERGDTLGVMLTNRPEFNVVDTAAMHLGATPFSIYNTSAPEQIAYLFSDAGNRIVVTERQFVDRLLAVRAAGTPIEHIVVVDGGPEGTLSLDDVEAAPAEDFDFDAAWRAVEPDDVLTLIYTSGTTGPPKGVELTHANILAEIRAVHAALPAKPGGRGVSFLPSAHIADRWGTHYSGLMVWGFTITTCADPKQVMEVVAQVRPTIFGSVPRIWEKVMAALEAAIAAESSLPRRALMRWAIGTGMQRVRAEQAREQVGPLLRAQAAIADALVASKIRHKLGLDQCEWFVVGAAPTPREVLEFFAAVGIPICELWGMSELSCVATINPPDAIRIGTVGLPLPSVEVKLAQDGELLCRGPIVMKGYRNKPAQTAEAIDGEGWLHTGDVAEIDRDGYVRLVDRKKELIINAAGKNMSPANIEARIKSSSPVIGQAVCIGDARPYNVALVTLDPDGAAGRTADDPEIQAEVAAAIDRANAQLSRVEQIKKYALLGDEWLPGGDELTPTMKLKRKPIAAKYAAQIESLYSG